MKQISWVVEIQTNIGSKDAPNIITTLLRKKGEYSQANYAIAKKEACNGEVTVEEIPDTETEPTIEERVQTLETGKAEQSQVDELNEALEMILSGVTE